MGEAEDILIVDHAEDILIAPDSHTGPRGLSRQDWCAPRAGPRTGAPVTHMG